jgi:glycosyltransferase involved in cell wall biosynthesis
VNSTSGLRKSLIQATPDPAGVSGGGATIAERIRDHMDSPSMHLRPGTPGFTLALRGQTLLQHTILRSYLPVTQRTKRAMSRILDDHVPAVFHGNGFGHPFVDTFIEVALAKKVRTVLTVHGLPNLERYTAIIRASGRAYLRSHAHILEAADALVCPSESVARALPRLTSRVPEVIPWGVEPPQPIASERLRPFPALVTVGRVVPLKRYEVLIRALSDVRAAWPDASLLIVGPIVHRRYARRLHEAIRALDLMDHVHLVGGLKLAESRQVMTTADVFVSVSSQESFGLAVLEALASGTPTVATDVGIARQVVAPDHGRLLLPTATAVEVSVALLDLLARYDQASDAAQDAMKGILTRYSWQETARRYSILFELN